MEKPIIFAGENPDNMNYPIGIQTFAKLREDDFYYVDKTAYVYRLRHPLPRHGKTGGKDRYCLLA